MGRTPETPRRLIGPTLNDLEAANLLRQGDIEGFEKFVRTRARFFPHLYRDDSLPTIPTPEPVPFDKLPIPGAPSTPTASNDRHSETTNGVLIFIQPNKIPSLTPPMPIRSDLWAGLPTPGARKERVVPPPRLAEKAFFHGFFDCLQIEGANTTTRRKTIETDTGEEERRRLAQGTVGIWAEEVKLFPHRLVMAFSNNTYRNLFLEETGDELFSSEIFPPYLLGKIKGQRTQRRIPFTDQDLVRKFQETFQRLFGQELGRVDVSTSKAHGETIRYYTIVLDANVLGLLREHPAVKGMRFYKAIFPEEKTQI